MDVVIIGFITLST